MVLLLTKSRRCAACARWIGGKPPSGEGVKRCGLFVTVGAVLRTIVLFVSATSSCARRPSSSDVSSASGEKGSGGGWLFGGGGGSEFFTGEGR